MNRKELIKKYIEFFKAHGHAQIKNSSLIPENDPTVLFTTAGMHPLVPYLLGQSHPQGKRLVNIQRCIRTVDIDVVGDASHHTFFEMTGNWSLGDYWKSEALKMSLEFATKELGLPIERIAVTVFEGDEKAPRDEESVKIWKDLGIPKERIAYLPGEDNWWGPAGETGPCGPCTELYYWKPNNIPAPKVYDPTDNNWLEIWNDVLMEYNKNSEGEYVKASQQNIDNGRGLERMLAVINGFEDNYLTEIWIPVIKKIEQLSGKSYKGNESPMRIIADHIKAASFIINDGITPGNADQPYILRRLIRRAIRFGRTLGIENFTSKVAESIYPIYDDYNLDEKKINSELEKEEERFNETLEKGLKILEDKLKRQISIDDENNTIVDVEDKFTGESAFLLFQSYGFPLEMTIEILKEKEVNLDFDKLTSDFSKELAKHQELSRTASAGKFKSGLADNSESTTKLHTASHLLNQALRIVLKDDNIFQKGSNITPDRLRFDFNFDRKLTDEEKDKVENLINQKISESLPVTVTEMSVEEANSVGAIGVFEDKYGDKVKVYSIGDFSKEICAGPHVQNTSEMGKFKIIKEESSSAGVRRIKAVLE
jgi:alanyl-tRNA synthetase